RKAMGTPATPTPSLPAPAAAKANAPVLPTPSILSAMLRMSKEVSDLIFSPGRPPQVELNGRLTPVKVEGLATLTPEDTARIAADLIGKNKMALEKLRLEGSCDISYSLPRMSRFRVNIFTQRGTCAIVMRVIPNSIPDFDTFNLPPQLAKIAELKNGIVLVTGPTGSGKSSTLAAIINKINQEKPIHIVTIEDPIEFLHPHRVATIHQRELHSDTPSFSLALRAALRQAPKVILVGEMRDKETIETALEAAETGHLVFSTLHTVDASKTIERIIGVFPLSDQHTIRARFAKTFRYIVSQRLLPRKGGGRVAAIEILISTMRTREYVEKGEQEGKSLLDAMRDGALEGMQHFDGVIEKMIREGVVEMETGLVYATNAGNLRLELADLLGAPPPAAEAPPPKEDSAGGSSEMEFER
ncbi:MAG TPA: PilT/PilU family type 4a pilus ATPase, partial [Candidatus Acidoferrales bacterium]|nr:PilT/PilU family type 4a pilus ATPase [Candidatus Acidoferrales bacterium]